jgi:eukaryotic-like serine/threonine-protein kinase
MAIMARVTMQAVPSIRMVRSTVPDSVEAVIFHALEKTPADRFATIDEFKDALLSGNHGMTSTFAKSTPMYTAAYRAAHGQRGWNRRRSMAGAAAAVVLLAGSVVAAKAVFGTTSTSSAGAIDASNIAVLYFDDDSKDRSLRFLADGLTESLIEQLDAVPGLTVMSSGAVRPFRGKSIGSDSVGRALQIGAVVRGSVEPAGAGVKVTVRLMDAQSDVDIAHTSVELDTAKVATLQRAVAEQVADFLRSQLGHQVRLRDQRSGTTSAQAWMLIQRAEKRRKDSDSLLAQGGADAAEHALGQADSLLAKAATIDGEGVEVFTARARLAYARAQALGTDVARLKPVVDSGLQFADRAIALDPRNADALQYKGSLLFLQYQQHLLADPRQAERALTLAESTLTRAVAIDKAHAGAWAQLSAVYARNSQLQAAYNAANNAYRADAYLSSARVVMIRLFNTSYNLESFPEATQWCDQGRRRFPAEPYFVQCRLMMYLAKSNQPDVDSAWTYARQYASLLPEPKRPLGWKRAQVFVAGAIVRAGLPDSARHVLARTRATPQEDPRHDVEAFEAIVRVMLGEQGEAVRLLESYLTVNPEHRAGFASRTVWWWRDLQNDPKFQRIIANTR